MANIFISYKRNVEPDVTVAKAIYNALRREHEVFIDTTIQVGEKWAKRIQQSIINSDYLIIFLSAHSVNSEMVIAEIETAYQQNKAFEKPVILPVRLNFNQALVYPLSAYLNPLQWALWSKKEDTIRLIDELREAIAGGSLPQNLNSSNEDPVQSEEIPTAFANIVRDLGSPEGTMANHSPYYVDRKSDREAIRALYESKGATIAIKGSRQMGKSSLLNRIFSEGYEQGMKSAFIDFQLIEKATIERADTFYRQFCGMLAWEFGLEDRTKDVWRNALGHVQNSTNYLEGYILDQIPNTPILLAMDEVERMFSSPFRSDFFSMLRVWHNNRARGGDWSRLNLVLVTSTEPYQLITDLNQSPFNVGTVVELSDFNLEQVEELNQRHGNPLNSGELQELIRLLGGHPYLTRKSLYLVSTHRMRFKDLLIQAYEDDGPFGDHLRNHLFRMNAYPELQDGFLQVIHHKRCANEHIFFRLRGAGLVKRTGVEIFPRNLLYTTYFERRLDG